MLVLHVKFLEEVVALVIADDEGREVNHLDLPDGLHAQLWIFQHLYLFDTVLSQDGGRATDRAEVEASIVLTSVCHLLRPVALGKRDQAATVFLEQIDV